MIWSEIESNFSMVNLLSRLVILRTTISGESANLFLVDTADEGVKDGYIGAVLVFDGREWKVGARGMCMVPGMGGSDCSGKYRDTVSRSKEWVMESRCRFKCPLYTAVSVIV